MVLEKNQVPAPRTHWGYESLLQNLSLGGCGLHFHGFESPNLGKFSPQSYKQWFWRQNRVPAPKPHLGREVASKTLVWEPVGYISMVSGPRNQENKAHSLPNNGFGDKIKSQLPGRIWDASFCSKTLVWEPVGYIFMVSGPRNLEN